MTKNGQKTGHSDGGEIPPSSKETFINYDDVGGGKSKKNFLNEKFLFNKNFKNLNHNLPFALADRCKHFQSNFYLGVNTISKFFKLSTNRDINKKNRKIKS